MSMDLTVQDQLLRLKALYNKPSRFDHVRDTIEQSAWEPILSEIDNTLFHVKSDELESATSYREVRRIVTESISPTIEKYLSLIPQYSVETHDDLVNEACLAAEIRFQQIKEIDNPHVPLAITGNVITAVILKMEEQLLKRFEASTLKAEPAAQLV